MLKKFAAAGILTAAAAGVVLLGGPANADVNTNGNSNIPIPVSVNVPVNVPVTVCGNSVPVSVSSGTGPSSIGNTSSGCEGDAVVAGNDQGISGY